MTRRLTCGQLASLHIYCRFTLCKLVGSENMCMCGGWVGVEDRGTRAISLYLFCSKSHFPNSASHSLQVPTLVWRNVG